MIGVDTNVVLRLLVPESPAETRRAAAFFAARSADDPVHIGLIVIAELVWVLDRKYGYSRHQAVAAVRYLLDTPEVVVDRAALVMVAIDRVEKYGTDIADELIAAVNADEGCPRTMTFDRDAAKRIPGMELLK